MSVGNVGSPGRNWPWTVDRLLCSDTKVLNTVMSTMQSNGILGIMKKPNSVGGNAVGVLSKSFLILSKHFCTLLLIILCTLVVREMSHGSCQ